jgi:hypothetical protein
MSEIESLTELRIRYLNGNRGTKDPILTSRYQDPGFTAPLKAVWRETDYICCQNLKKAMPIWLPADEAIEEVFKGDIRIRLLSIRA